MKATVEIENIKYDKLHLDLSVSEIAYMVKLMFDRGIILNKNKKGVIRLLVQFLVTKKVDEISINSMKNKMTIPNYSTVKRVSKILSELTYDSKMNETRF